MMPLYPNEERLKKCSKKSDLNVDKDQNYFFRAKDLELFTQKYKSSSLTGF
ncbi:hypothetical protein DFR44_12811 [Hydromonas duriensis]|uniref:Uncharacterized protein n=1 Tax=Hydromonas duriensis TaxID=1527608 RepID=A0A4R6Y4P9_9BURK|nr:hypothetical protein DFR44_12811 [Hydromonas duriensis]